MSKRVKKDKIIQNNQCLMNAEPIDHCPKKSNLIIFMIFHKVVLRISWTPRSVKCPSWWSWMCSKCLDDKGTRTYTSSLTLLVSPLFFQPILRRWLPFWSNQFFRRTPLSKPIIKKEIRCWSWLLLFLFLQCVPILS